ncbi:MAG: phosphoribosylglycinamide formyltransferase [Tenacibaculum sp.]
MQRIVIFASGSGSNAENIISYFKNSKKAKVSHVLSNNKDAGVFERCKRLRTNAVLFNKEDFLQNDTVLNFLLNEADFIVLAGFLWKVPLKIIEAFSNKIINIHPSLLPKYGGKGMFGMRIHRAVIKNNEIETGITVHYVNEFYDKGAIIFQAKIPVLSDDNPKSIAQKISALERKHFPIIIKNLIFNQI